MITHKSLKELVTSGMGRKHTEMIVDALRQNNELFPDLVELYLANEEPASRRAVWAVDLWVEEHPDLILPYLNAMVDHLPVFHHAALKRHTLRILVRSPLPKANLGKLISCCFDLLISPSEPPAVKVWAMEILYRTAIEEPDLRKELIDTIEWRLEEESAGVQNRARKILKRLYSHHPYG